MTGKVNAVVSGQSGVALLVQGGELASLHAGRGVEVVQRRPSEARFLLGDAMDLQVLENVELEEVSRRLELAASQMDAFHTVLILLDGSLSADTRQEAAGEFQELTEGEQVTVFLESVLFAHPLPAEADLQGAFAACSRETERTRAFLHRLVSLQEHIAEVRRAWETIPAQVFGAENREQICSVAVKEGLFRDLALCRAAAIPIGEFLDGSLLKSKISRDLLLAWGAALDNFNAAPSWLNGSNKQFEAKTPADSTQRSEPVSSQPKGVANENDPVGSRQSRQRGKKYPSLDDSELQSSIAELRAGVRVETNSKRIFEVYYPWVRRFFGRLGYTSQVSAELTQDTFVRLFSHMESFRNESSLNAWLFALAANIHRAEVRRRHAARRNAAEGSLDAPVEHTSSPGEPRQEDSPARPERGEERREALMRAVKNLPLQMREVIALRAISELKYREIAAVLQISIQTVKLELFQARRQLHAELGDGYTAISSLLEK